MSRDDFVAYAFAYAFAGMALGLLAALLTHVFGVSIEIDGVPEFLTDAYQKATPFLRRFGL